MKVCVGCGVAFFPNSNRQKWCKRCRAAGAPKARPARVSPMRPVSVVALRRCEFCGAPFRPRRPIQKFCSEAHRYAARNPVERELLYNRAHREDRKRWAPRVASGTVICSGSMGCGRLILPGEPWDLGHEPGGPSRPQHARCNRATAGKRKGPRGGW